VGDRFCNRHQHPSVNVRSDVRRRVKIGPTRTDAHFMAATLMTLRYATRCHSCGIDLPARSKGVWDKAVSRATCAQCFRPRELPAPAPVDIGVAGESLGALTALYGAESCEKGRAGERAMELLFNDRLADSAVMLHDRRIRGRHTNIDHLVIASSGVWVVDAKNYTGRIECRDLSTWDAPHVELRVNGRNSTRNAEGLVKQRQAVIEALATIGMEAAPVESVLCFVGLEQAPSGRLHRVLGSLATSPTELIPMIKRPGPVSEEAIRTISHHLSATFPAKR
jgi:hypothetical protein